MDGWMDDKWEERERGTRWLAKPYSYLSLVWFVTVF